MKSIVLLVAFCGVMLGQSCPLEPVELAPIGMANAKHQCVCEGVLPNCHWAWVASNTQSNPQVKSLDPAIVNALANAPANQAAQQAATREANARADEAEAKAEAIRQETLSKMTPAERAKAEKREKRRKVMQALFGAR
jgi:hypothetical protein